MLASTRQYIWPPPEADGLSCAELLSAYIQNAGRDARLPRHRRIATANAAFAARVAPRAPAVRILKRLGFAEVVDAAAAAPSGGGVSALKSAATTHLELSHANPAPFLVASGAISSWLDKACNVI